MIILASRSAARKALLDRAGVSYAVQASPFDEERVKTQLNSANPQDFALKLASGKAQALSQLYPTALVIGADQTLSCQGNIFHKPMTREAARHQLRSLRGKTHTLWSAASCAQDGDITWSCSEQAEITLRDFSDAFLEDYLDAAGEDVLSSAGAYHYEGVGIRLMDHVLGNDHVILGLPLFPLLKHLRSVGFLGS